MKHYTQMIFTNSKVRDTHKKKWGMKRSRAERVKLCEASANLLFCNCSAALQVEPREVGAWPSPCVLLHSPKALHPEHFPCLRDVLELCLWLAKKRTVLS